MSSINNLLAGNLYEKIEDEHQLLEFQENLLRQTVRRAYEAVPFYREKLEKINKKPEDIKTIEDLSALYQSGVKTKKEDLFESTILPEWIRERRVPYAPLMTSGTKGMPKLIPYTKDDIRISNIRGRDAFQLIIDDNKDKVFMMLAPSPYSSGPLAISYVFSESAINVPYIVSQAPLPPEFINKIIEKKFNVIISSPTRLISILPQLTPSAREIIEKVILSAEPTSQAQYRIIKEYLPNLHTAATLLASTETKVAGIGDLKENVLVMHPMQIVGIVKDERAIFYGEGKTEGIDLVTNLYPQDFMPGIFLINYSHGDLYTEPTFGKTKIGDKTVYGILIRQPVRADEILNVGGYKIDPLDLDDLPVGDYIVICEEGDDKQKITVRILGGDNINEEMVLRSLTKSNPPAIYALQDMLKNGQLELEIKIVKTQQELYEGIRANPTKKTRVVRM